MRHGNRRPRILDARRLTGWAFQPRGELLEAKILMAPSTWAARRPRFCRASPRRPTASTWAGRPSPVVRDGASPTSVT